MDPKQVARGMLDLAPLPEVCLKVAEAAEDPATSREALVKLISTDGALAAQILRIANSAFYGYSSKIVDLEHAVQAVGTDAIRNLVYVSCLLASYGAMESRLINSKNFWRHGLYTAIVARNLAKRCKVSNSERFFIAGLLHDVGRLALYSNLESDGEAILEYVEEQQVSLTEAEFHRLSFDHAEVSYELLSLWNLPENLKTVARYHHAPELAKDYELEVSIVHLAEGIARGAGVFGSPEDIYIKLSEFAWNMTGLNDDIIDEIVVNADTDYVDIAALFIERSYSTPV